MKIPTTMPNGYQAHIDQLCADVQKAVTHYALALKAENKDMGMGASLAVGNLIGVAAGLMQGSFSPTPSEEEFILVAREVYAQSARIITSQHGDH